MAWVPCTEVLGNNEIRSCFWIPVLQTEKVRFLWSVRRAESPIVDQLGARTYLTFGILGCRPSLSWTVTSAATLFGSVYIPFRNAPSSVLSLTSRRNMCSSRRQVAEPLSPKAEAEKRAKELARIEAFMGKRIPNIHSSVLCSSAPLQDPL